MFPYAISSRVISTGAYVLLSYIVFNVLGNYEIDSDTNNFLQVRKF